MQLFSMVIQIYFLCIIIGDYNTYVYICHKIDYIFPIFEIYQNNHLLYIKLRKSSTILHSLTKFSLFDLHVYVHLVYICIIMHLHLYH